MPEKSITFLSTRGAGLSSDLKLVEENLMKGIGEDGVSYRFFLKNGRSENPMARQGFIRAKREFCESMTNVICADTSLSGVAKAEQESARILLGSPYDYQFKNELILRGKKEDFAGWKTLQGFTHIIPGSPFTEQLVKKAYQLEEVTVLSGLCLPSVWDLNRPEKQEEKREGVTFYFPAAEKKRILALLIYGDDIKRRTFLKGFDIRRFLKVLGKDWFVMTNLEEMMEAAYTLNARYRDSFGYAGRILPGSDLLYMADALVTNNGRFASYFASRHKPMYCVTYKDNFFERYMKRCHPAMCLVNSEDFMRADFGMDGIPEGQREFDRLFSYEELKSPYETIAELIK